MTIRSSSRPPRPRAPFAHGGAERSAATEEPFASPPNSGTIRRATLPESILLMTLDAPLEQGPRVTARFLVRELSSLLPGLAVGLCLRTSSPSGHAVSLPWIEADYPVSVAEPGAEAPLRLFSSLEPELVLEIDGAGSTLHLARRAVPSTASPTVRDGSRPGAGPHLDASLLGFSTEEQEEAFLHLATRAIRRCLELSQRESRRMEEQERLRARVAHSDKLATLGQITAGILHELSNPLTSIVAYTDQLRRRVRSRREAGEAAEDELMKLDRIAESAERIARFSEDLLSHARPSGEPMARVSLLEVVEKSITFCEHELARHGVLLERAVGDATPFVRGSSSQLVQVFVNLITNAIHAASEGGREIVVHAHSEEGFGVVRVSDNGPGVAHEHLDRIFDPFFTTKPEGQGTGLGLAIVQELVVRHGGLIEVESSLGRGTSFVVRLPIA